MNDYEFNTIMNKRFEQCRNILCKKNKEYSSDTDRLHNFKEAAILSNTTPEKALWGMLLKHIVSVMDMVKCPEKATNKAINEKIGDCINYFVLLESLFKEKI